MTELDTRWAWTQVEAMAEGSLSRQDERRMRAALGQDRELRAAVERARGLRRELRRLGRAPVPRSLYGRLLGIAGPRAAGRRPTIAVWSWTSAAAAASAVAAALVLMTQPEPADDPRTAALRDFELAMAYLHKSYEIAGEQVKRAMERELREALGVNTERGGNDAGAGNGG